MWQTAKVIVQYAASPSKRQDQTRARLCAVLPAEPRYTPLEQWLFWRLPRLTARVARAEEERVEFADKLKVLEDVVWKLLRNQGGYVTEVVEAVMEQEEVEDETGILTAE